MAVHYDAINWLNFSSYEDIRFFEIGKQQCDIGYSYGPIIRDKFVLHYILSGEGYLTINQKTYHIKEKQAFLIPPGVLAHYQASTDNPWHYIWLQFHGLKASEIMLQAELSQNNPVFIPNDDTTNMEDTLFSILNNPSNEYICIGKLYEFFHYLVALSSAPSSPKTEADHTLKYIHMVIDYIKEKYSEPIQVQDIANYCGLERSYLGKLFKKTTGRTPKEYLVQIRMNHAKSLLANTDIPIQHVSYSVGYSDQLSFSKIFKKEIGLSPSEYRNQKHHPKDNL